MLRRVHGTNAWRDNRPTHERTTYLIESREAGKGHCVDRPANGVSHIAGMLTNRAHDMGRHIVVSPRHLQPKGARGADVSAVSTTI
eukprot:scaffold291598_cov33-Tisochrysis_lutea.AAC.2